MADNDKRMALYNQAKSSGMAMPDTTTFNSLMDDPDKRKKFYDAAVQNNIPMPKDYTDYESAIGGTPKTFSLNVPKSNPTIPASLAVPSSTSTRSPFNTYTEPDRTVEGAIAPFKKVGKTLSNAAEDIAFGRPAAGVAGGGEAGLQAGLALTGFPSLIGALESNPFTNAKTPLFPSIADVANAPFGAVQNLYNASAGGLIDKAQNAMCLDPYTKSKVNELSRQLGKKQNPKPKV